RDLIVQANFQLLKAMSHPREQYLIQLMRVEGTRHSLTQTDDGCCRRRRRRRRRLLPFVCLFCC
ncbi:unnamed protein product, partial [Sphagnum compactum]